jgi:GntR family transcriptional regulator, transcriptional repressor for pyruvate dehydrogenase complex
MAATRATSSDLDEIDRLIGAQRRKVRAGEPTIGEDTAFHAALARATHNPVIVGIMETLNDLLVESRKMSLKQKGRPERSIRGHEAVVSALRRRNPDAAARAMHTHIEQIAALVRRTIDRP